MKLPVALLTLLASTALAAPKTEAQVAAANAKAFDAALAKKKVAVLVLKEELREHDMYAGSAPAPASAAGHVDLVVNAGWNAEEIAFVVDAKHGVYRLRRAPKVVAKIEEHLGCRAAIFAGGRGWTDHVRYALPAGYTYKGELDVAYDVTSWVTVDATTKPDGTPCPQPGIMLD